MKVARHEKIKELIQQYDIDTQEELASRLNEAGFKVTQATVSRDIRALKMMKVTGKDGKSQSLADTCDEADALASCGQGNATLQFPVMDKVIGTMDYIESQIGGWAGCVNEDGSFEAELQIIIASTIANGFNHLAAKGY